MESFEVFEQNIIEMLNHLYDPVYRPPELIWKALRISRESGIQSLQEAILEGIEDLKPAPQVPLTARAWRIYGMLRYRYVEGLPQEATAEKLGITARHLRRNFSDAIHALSLRLWEKYGGALADGATSPGAHAPDVEDARMAAAEQVPQAAGQPQALLAEEAQPEPDQSADVNWQAQLVRELESLEETAAGAVSNIAETVTRVFRLVTPLTAQRSLNLSADPISPRLMAAIHPSALRQILIAVIDALARQMDSGEISLSASPAGGKVEIALTGSPLAAASLNNFERISEMLSSFNIEVTVRMKENIFQITMLLLQVDRCVLVIDDNMDMAHLYRRYLAGTRYYLQHVNRGEKTFEAIDLYHPDLVVLDVMLPDIDGWDLLTRLHETPETRPLPVLICSVMREKELAQALGASYYLTKPVQRQDFIRALDTVLQQG